MDDRLGDAEAPITCTMGGGAGRGPSPPEFQFVDPAPDDRGAVVPEKLRWATSDADGDLIGTRISVSADGRRWRD